MVLKNLMKAVFGKTSQGNYRPRFSLGRYEPLVSFIIPMRNEHRSIRKCLMAVLDDSYEKKEVIVVDDESTDDSYQIVSEIAAKNKEIKLFKNKKRLGPGGTKNRAFDKSSGEILIFIDAHSIIKTRDFVKKYVRHYTDPKVGAVAGGRSFIPSYYQDKVLYYSGGLRPWREMGFQFLDTPNSSFRREVFLKMGKIDSCLTWGSDLSNTFKILDMGYEISVEPGAAIEIDHSITPSRWIDFIRKPFFYGTVIPYVVVPYFKWLRKRKVDLRIVAGGLLNLSAIICACIWPQLSYIPLITILYTRLHSIAFAVYERAPIKYIAGIPFVLTISEISYACGFIYGCFRRITLSKTIRY